MRENVEVKTVDIKDGHYPESLRNIPDPPQKLYYKGDYSLVNTPCISIVGSRKATPYGIWVATQLAKKLAENGITVVSGMAMGIDSVAHRGALKAKEGNTIAVLGCGIDGCYPTGNRGLKREIEQSGLVISEYPDGIHGTKFTYPRRNRIISGLSMATVVVEAGLNSGSLITAERAAEQGRQVFAVPGNINSVYSFGSNKLISEGVMPLMTIDEIFEFLNIKRQNSIKIDEVYGEEQYSDIEGKILKIVYNMGEADMDTIADTLKISISEASGIVTILEIKGAVYTSMGKIFIAN